jgi:hypothetical protein
MSFHDQGQPPGISARPGRRLAAPPAFAGWCAQPAEAMLGEEGKAPNPRRHEGAKSLDTLGTLFHDF